MIGDRVLDDFQKFLLRVDGSDCEPMEELNHKTGESFESSWYSDSGADFNEDSSSGVDVDLKFPRLIDGRVQQGKKTLRRINKTKLSYSIGHTWWVISGLASLISRFILRITPMCSSLFSSEYFSSRGAPGLLPP